MAHFYMLAGYIRDEGYTSTYKIFIKECPYLTEYVTMLKQGREFPLSVAGITLTFILDEYSRLKKLGMSIVILIKLCFLVCINELYSVSFLLGMGAGPSELGKLAHKHSLLGKVETYIIIRKEIQAQKKSIWVHIIMFKTQYGLLWLYIKKKDEKFSCFYWIFGLNFPIGNS